GRERLVQTLGGGGFHLAEKAERHVNLLLAHPPEPAQMRIEPRQRFAANGGEFEPEKETLRHQAISLICSEIKATTAPAVRPAPARRAGTARQRRPARARRR